ncbi:hypothetical protein F383_21318 [Gossypium arboreum]|uniref:Uncharacterized protein n=1 Tax=Gossypium arboreum TaxID=29729 RepID=A0A0B0NVP2_GOSAR|nr:hypothetical protein F383_21318 [Gossypium arboreum]
MPLSQTGSNMK